RDAIAVPAVSGGSVQAGTDPENRTVTDGFRTHSLTIQRLAVTQNSTGGQVRAYTTAARGALPRSIEGRAVRMSQKEKLEYGVRGELTGWQFLIEDDPSATINDRIVFSYSDGDTRTVKVTNGSQARSADARFYRVVGEEVTQES